MNEPEQNPRHKLNPLMLEMLVCPLTKTRLMLARDSDELISIAARLAFPITGGVPLLSLDEARTIEGDELERLSRHLR